MSQYANMIRALKTPWVMSRLTHLYGRRDGMLVSQTARYIRLLKRHEELFDVTGEVQLISAPGRTELSGNHTDHNRGKVLAAAVNLDTVAAVSRRDDLKVRLCSEGYPAVEISLTELKPVPAEEGKTAALIRGVAARMKELNYPIGGFDAAVTSNVLSGSGLSSSAAFEVLLCAIFDSLYGNFQIPAPERAKIAQFAENRYFGKPSGLMDQMASSVGGLVAIDFKKDDPDIKPLAYDFAAKGYALVVVGTGGSHDDLTADYATIPQEMKQVAACFGEDVLRRVRPEQLFQELASVRQKTSDRAVLRAIHFFQENKRVADQTDALMRDDLQSFFRDVVASGRSSFMYLQNVYARPNEQQLSLALALAESQLGANGAWRVHGGGFAGTTLNFVPLNQVPSFTESMEAVFGPHCCHQLDIRPEGAARIEGLE
jgi:galactokinase